MDTQSLTNFVNKTIDDKLNSMINMVVPNHIHNGWDSNQLDPSISLTGFPVIQVTDATVTPTDTPDDGTFRFYVDATPRYRLWVWLVYQDATGVLVGSWRVITL